jgi:hypothetical protein
VRAALAIQRALGELNRRNAGTSKPEPVARIGRVALMLDQFRPPAIDEALREALHQPNRPIRHAQQ